MSSEMNQIDEVIGSLQSRDISCFEVCHFWTTQKYNVVFEILYSLFLYSYSFFA